MLFSQPTPFNRPGAIAKFGLTGQYRSVKVQVMGQTSSSASY